MNVGLHDSSVQQLFTNRLSVATPCLWRHPADIDNEYTAYFVQ